MVSKNQDALTTKVVRQALALVDVRRNSFKFVVTNVTEELCTVKVVVAQTLFLASNGHASGRVRVDDAMSVVSHGVDRTVNDKAGQIHRIFRAVQDVAFQVNLHEIPGRDLRVVQSVWVDQEVRLRAWHTERDV